MVSMYELSDVSAKGSIRRQTPTVHHIDEPVRGYGAADDLEYLYDRPKFEDGEVLSYFKSRRVSRGLIFYWVVLQSFMLFFQLVMYSEVSVHSSLYDTVVHAHCNDTLIGSCKSPLWQTWYQNEHKVVDLEAPVHFDFVSTGTRPMSIQVTVVPNPPNLHFPFELTLHRHKSGETLLEKTFHEFRTTGLNTVTITEDNSTSVSTNFDFIPTVAWEGAVHLVASPYSYRVHEFHPRHQSRMISSTFRDQIKSELISVKIIVNEVNAFEIKAFEHLVGNKCEFEKTWSSLMLKSMNFGGTRLWWISTFLALSILASAIVTFLVWNWWGGRRVVDGLNFHYLVFAKSVLQDMPLQVIVLGYICSWYEAGGGERCQLCMLDPHTHCESMHPFHYSNFLLVFIILASSLSNQILFTADTSKLKTEDDASFVLFVRFVLACLTILPFSTAMVAFNGSLVQLPGLVHTLFLLPCFTGWVALFSLICFPITTVLDDDDYIYG